MSHLRICHFAVCFLLSASLIIGLTRKDLKKVSVWNWITRACYGVMIVTGAIMWIPAVHAVPAHSLVKSILAIVLIVFIEFVYSWKKNGKLTKKGVILLVILILLTILCGCTLFRTLSFL